MKTADFMREHNAFREGAKWALSVSSDMSEVWDALVNQGQHEGLLWTATQPAVFPDSVLRKLACRFVRETPIGGGRTVWDLLTDERSRKTVEVAERYADGDATEAELDAATYSADAAAFAASWAVESASAAAWAAAYAAKAVAADAAHFAADAAKAAADAADAKSAQVQMIAELGNPFKKGSDK